MGSSDNITFAIIGHGQAANSFYNSLVGLPGVHFRWIIGRRPEATAKYARERGIPNHGIELEAVLADPTVDAILICSPNTLHDQQALLALQAGKHAIIEVPMTMSYREAQRLVKVASESGLFISVPHNARYLRTIKRAKELLVCPGVGADLPICLPAFTVEARTKGLDRSATILE